MSTPFGIVAACEHKNVEPGKSTLWASIKIEPRGKALEAERAPLAVALVIDVSGSMQGDPIDHVLRSCEIVADLLGERDQLAVVTFSTHAGVRCGLTTVDAPGRAAITASLRGVVADGNTNMHGGIEVAAGVLMSAAAGLRRVMVVLSDGRPNVGLSSATDLATFVRGLKLAVSSLGFGLSHDENVLAAIATAGSGRYAYIPDPALARVDLARAALAHGGIVADHLELKLVPAAGVELVQLIPQGQLRVGGGGVTTAIGDVFVDEGRAYAIELALDLAPTATGRLVELAVEGQAPDGTRHRATATLDVDIRTGPPVIDRDAQRAIVMVQADLARSDARAQADRRAYPAAAVIIRRLIARIEATEGFVRDDGSMLAELREQLEDEALSYERVSNDVERAHQRKAGLAYNYATPVATPAAGRRAAPIAARLVGIGGPVLGQEHQLCIETAIGRTNGNDVVVPSGALSKRHTRILFVGGSFRLQDLGSTNGSTVNGVKVNSAALAHGDVIDLGGAVFRFELV